MVTKSQVAECIAEFFGTLILVFTVGCNAPFRNALCGPLVVACVLSALCFAFGPVSGGYLNPAITLAAAVTGQLQPTKALAYVFAQFFGGLVGAVFCAMVFWQSFTIGPNRGFNWISMASAEMFYTFMLTFTVLNCTKAGEKSGFSLGWLAVGLSVVSGGFGAGAISGGAFNPAIAFGLDFSSGKLGFGWCFAYIGAEFFGAALAALCYRGVRVTLDPTGNNRVVSWVLSEFLGTFMLCLTVGLTLLGSPVWTAVAAGSCLTAMILALGDVSGGMFNPAVTASLLMSKQLKAQEAKKAVCVVAQLLAGIFAAMTVHFMRNFNRSPGGSSKFGFLATFPVEALLTMLLCLVVNMVVRSANDEDVMKTGATDGVTIKEVQIKGFGPGAIGLSVAGGAYTGSILTVGVMNPAVAVVVVWIAGGGAMLYGGFFLAEMLGAALAAGLLLGLMPAAPKQAQLPLVPQRSSIVSGSFSGAPANYGAAPAAQP